MAMSTTSEVLLIDSGPMEPALSMAADEVLARRISKGEREDTLHLYHRDRPAIAIGSRALSRLSVEECFAVLCGCIVKTLEHLGFRAEHRPPNDILVDGYKVSGSAQSRKGPAVLQHGTFVVDMDFGKAAAVFPGAEVLEDGKGLRFSSDPPRLVSSLRALGGKEADVKVVKGTFLWVLSEELGWRFADDGFTDDEKAEMAILAGEKYGDDEGWNLKR
jgi:lipoate-protein ligase A